jgi:hypothetical protein
VRLSKKICIKLSVLGILIVGAGAELMNIAGSAALPFLHCVCHGVRIETKPVPDEEGGRRCLRSSIQHLCFELSAVFPASVLNIT